MCVALGVLVPYAVAGAATSVNQASTSTRGVTATRITVVFPVANLEQLSTKLGFEAVH